jgi:hypothetical protein
MTSVQGGINLDEEMTARRFAGGSLKKKRPQQRLGPSQRLNCPPNNSAAYSFQPAGQTAGFFYGGRAKQSGCPSVCLARY